ncbi:hypothetical protein BG003_002869 [Podila horticola]|nr:hypothetical protein BG003_002869 [Podila horticola]
MSTAALDIALIVEVICDHLPLPDIRTCQQVSRQWSSIFKPHLWRVTKLTVTTPFPRAKLYTIIRNIPWIQSLKVAAIHLHKISHVHFSYLQELILYDDNYGNFFNEGAPVCVDTVCRLIEKSTELKGLEIDLNRYHYRSDRLVPSLMLAIAKHPSLIKWTWTVPDEALSHDFFERTLLYVCHQGSIQELHVDKKWNMDTACDCCGTVFEDGLVNRFSYRSMDLVQDDSPEYMALRANLDAETPLDQLGGPLAFKKLFMDGRFTSLYKDLLRLCPDLEYANVHTNFRNSDDKRIMDVLVENCPDLRGFNNLHCRYDPALPSDIGRFSRLQQTSFWCGDGSEARRILSALAQSHLDSLEVITTYLSDVSVWDALRIINTFPRLRVLDLTILKIYVHDQGSNEQEDTFLQSPADLQSLDMVVREWDCPISERIGGVMDNWWRTWEQAQQFMGAFSEEYMQWSEESRLRPVHMRFMLPLKYFMPQWDAAQYSNILEEGPKGRKLFTLEDAQRMVRERIKEQMSRYGYESEMEDEEKEESWDFDQEYEMSKSRNRHHTLRERRRSVFRRPFKK